MQQIILNPFAPSAYEGIVQPGTSFVDMDRTYVYDVTLTANQNLPNASVSLDRDADFLMMGVQISRATSSNFTLQLFDNQGQNFSDSPIYGAAYLIGVQSLPFPIVPARLFAAGGNIGIRIVDTSGSTNVIQILFRGVKRYMARKA